MSELLSVEPDQEPSPMSIPEQRHGESAEIIDFEKSSAELVIGAFLTELQAAIEQGEVGTKLAEHIETALSRTGTENASPLDNHLTHLAEANAFDSDEIYDHKAEHDPVFNLLIGKLQSTQKQQHELQDHRLAARKLIRLRASLTEDQTQQDELWELVINNLFSRSNQPQ